MKWTGNLGTGTSGYRAYGRNHEVMREGKVAPILGSSDKSFRGEDSRWNPEETLVASLSTCHMLWFLHLCADAGVVVTEYDDQPSGTMRENPDGSGEFVSVVLRPRVVTTSTGDLEALHHRAHEFCYISRSVNFPVEIHPRE